MLRSARRRLAVVTAAAVFAAAACSNGTSSAPNVDGSGQGKMSPAALAAEVANYDLAVGPPGRFLLGVFAANRERGLAYGTIELSFRFLDTTGPGHDGQHGPSVTAMFLPIPGQEPHPDAHAPALVPGSEAIGVYGADDVSFGRCAAPRSVASFSLMPSPADLARPGAPSR